MHGRPEGDDSERGRYALTQQLGGTVPLHGPGRLLLYQHSTGLLTSFCEILDICEVLKEYRRPR